LTGTVSVEGDVQNVIVNASEESGFQGQVHVGGSLLGTFEVNNGDVSFPGPATAILIDGDVGGDVLVHSALHRDLVVSGAVANSGSSIVLSSALPQLGSVSVSTGMHGTLDCAGTITQVDLWGVVDGSISLGDIVGPVNLWNGLDGTLTGGTLIGGALGGGELYIGGNNPEQGLNGTVTLSGAVEEGASINVGGAAGLAGSLIVGDLLGTVHVVFDASGALETTGLVAPSGVVQIDGDVTADGHVTVGTDLDGTLSLDTLNGYVNVRGGLSGRLEILGNVDKATVGHAISVDQDLAGQIRVYGSLYDDPNEVREIEIGGAMPFPGAIAVDWDGDQELDRWWPEAIIRVGQIDYRQNDWQARVYDISSCRGDLNGDESVGFPDINPFILALNDAQSGSSNYAAAFPGLEGSMTYHGDTTCDDPPHLGFEDINPFVALVTSGCCDADCPGCSQQDGDGMNGMMYEGGEGLPGMLPPEELAAQLAANVWPELYPDLVAMVAANIDLQPDEESQAYWQAVYAALTE
jgi:hypothetical protein